jgi:hypothetical protein
MIEVNCEHCGKSVLRSPAKMRKQKHVYCSNACHGYARDNPRGREHPRHLARTSGVTVGGYPVDIGSRHGHVRSLLVHRAVAIRLYLHWSLRIRREAFYWVDGGAFIHTGWVVHHIDEDKHNNDISNLVLMTRADHMRLHLHGRKVPEDVEKEEATSEQ